MTYSFDPKTAISSIKRFIVEKLESSGLSGYVVGLSGGIDSSLSATLAVAAVGPEKVLGLIMPYRMSSESSISDAAHLAEKLRIPCRVIDISPMIDAYYPAIDASLRIQAGNKMARERMSILFDIAYEMNRLVLGTGNRTEISLGYTTWFGDSACSLNPIGALYKTEVRQLARLLDVPPPILRKPPTADLWEGQTDEGEIGVAYEEIDQLLIRIIDEGERSMKKLEEAGLGRTGILRVVSLINLNAFKRRMPDIALLGKQPAPDHVRLSD